MRAILVESHGGPEVLTPADVPDPTVKVGEALIEVHYAGVNFIDTYQRSGHYDRATPFVPGLEGSGVVLEADERSHVNPGERVAWPFLSSSYAERVVLRDRDIYHVPEAVGLDTAAAAMLQGLTAHYLVTSVYAARTGSTVLIHAAAGGVGLLLTQMASQRGARVIGTVSSDEKEALARAAGAAEIIRYDRFDRMATDLPDAIRELTGGIGVDAVYDGVGAATFDGSLASLARRGTMALFGAASGPVPPFDLQRLNAGGSLSIVRPSLSHYLASQAERDWRSAELWQWIEDGALNVRIDQVLPLEKAADAHRLLESRASAGKVLLKP